MVGGPRMGNSHIKVMGDSHIKVMGVIGWKSMGGTWEREGWKLDFQGHRNRDRNQYVQTPLPLLTNYYSAQPKFMLRLFPLNI